MTNAAQTVRRLWESFADHDWDRAADQLAADVVVSWPQSGEAFVGREDFIAMNRAHPAPNWRIDSIEVVDCGSTVVVRVVVPTDVAVEVCIAFCRVGADGRISESTEYWTEHSAKPTPDWRARWTNRPQRSGITPM